MAKTYILEPIEVEFVDGYADIDPFVLSDEDVSAIPSNAIMSVGDETFKFCKIDAVPMTPVSSETFSNAYFTPDGEDFDEETYTGIYATFCKHPANERNMISRYDYGSDDQLQGTYTVSIYTGEDDPEPDPEPTPTPSGSGSISKNFAFVDHPRNDLAGITEIVAPFESEEN